MRALEIFDTDEHGKLAGSLEEILRLADPPASRLTWTLRYIEARDDVTAAWPAGLRPRRGPRYPDAANVGSSSALDLGECR